MSTFQEVLPSIDEMPTVVRGKVEHLSMRKSISAGMLLDIFVDVQLYQKLFLAVIPVGVVTEMTHSFHIVHILD
jgi:hypothetical protein